MPLVKRGDKRYFYESVRIGSRVGRRYVGHGPTAELAAAAIQLRQSWQAAQAAALRAEQQRYAAAVAPLDELCRLTDLLLRATLARHGFHQHDRGAWRRRRHD